MSTLCQQRHRRLKEADSAKVTPAGRGRGMSLIEQVTARPTHAAHLASLSSHGEVDKGGCLMNGVMAPPHPSLGKEQRQARSQLLMET